jgi:hypothetical protein
MDAGEMPLCPYHKLKKLIHNAHFNNISCKHNISKIHNSTMQTTRIVQQYYKIENVHIQQL